MKHNKALLLVFFLFLMPVVLAVPPAQVSDYGLQIRVPVNNYIKQNTDFDFHSHIFIENNGLPILTIDNCTLHIYNASGSHIYRNWTNTIDDYDIEFEIPNTVFSDIGEKTYIIQCECLQCGIDNTDIGGFTAGTFIVTRSGYSRDRSLYYALGVLALCFFLTYLGSTLGENHIFLKIFLYFVVIFMLVFYGIGIFDGTIQDVGFYRAVLWITRLFVLYAFLYLMYNWLNYLGKVPKWAGGK